MQGVKPLGREAPLIAIVGPTGAGKSDLALSLASQFAGEIVNFDSVQLYRGFDIGSAKVPVEQRRGIPHHLLDIAEPLTEITAAEYARLAGHAIQDISRRGQLPVLVGGTGFYLRALLDGLSPAPPAQHELRERLRQAQTRRPGVLHRFLSRFDPPAAVRIHPNDIQKVSRAVEVTIAAARPVTQIQAASRNGLSGYRVLKLGIQPPRGSLAEHLSRRAEWMFSNGLLEETQRLLASGVPLAARAMGSLGYKQAAAALQGRLTIEAAISECQTRTRQYAKRQMTWFRAEKDVHWLTGFGSDPAVVTQASDLTLKWLRGSDC